MKFDILKSRIVAWGLIILGALILAANAYNSFVDTGRFDVQHILTETFHTLGWIVGGIATLLAGNRDHEGNLLKPKTIEAEVDEFAETEAEIEADRAKRGM